MSFVFVSGAGADRTERGNMMWARIKGKTENALLAMPFRSVYVFRPAMIQPLDGIESKTPSYRIMYRLYSAVSFRDPPLLAAIHHNDPGTGPSAAGRRQAGDGNAGDRSTTNPLCIAGIYLEIDSIRCPSQSRDISADLPLPAPIPKPDSRCPTLKLLPAMIQSVPLNEMHNCVIS